MYIQLLLSVTSANITCSTFGTKFAKDSGSFDQVPQQHELFCSLKAHFEKFDYTPMKIGKFSTECHVPFLFNQLFCRSNANDKITSNPWESMPEPFVLTIQLVIDFPNTCAILLERYCWSGMQCIFWSCFSKNHCFLVAPNLNCFSLSSWLFSIKKKIQKSIKTPLGCDYRHGFVSAYMKISHEMSK